MPKRKNNKIHKTFSSSDEDEEEPTRRKFKSVRPVSLEDTPLKVQPKLIPPEEEETENENNPENATPKTDPNATPISNSDKHQKSTNSENPVAQKVKKERIMFKHGNYLQYYGYRNKGMDKFTEPRLDALEYKKAEFFTGKDVLDIGCNSGHVTLLIAQKYAPRKIVGCDIDDKLIKLARKNIANYLPKDVDEATGEEIKPPASFLACHAQCDECFWRRKFISDYFCSIPIIFDTQSTYHHTVPHGPIDPPAIHCYNPDGTFPNNVLFFSGDYVPKNDLQVTEQTPEYDTIIGFSLTKWIHINNKDEGLLRFFQRVYNALRTDGYFIVEPQTWSSYLKKKMKLGVKLKENINSLKLRPDQFESILMKNIGFRKVWKIEPKVSESNEFNNFGKRTVLVFKK